MNTSTKRTQNILLILAVIVLALIPLWIVEKPAAGPDGEEAEIFAGADGQAEEMISKIAPDYEPWFSPLIEPASGEIESMLFALQAALGAGFIGYYLGMGRMREKMRREIEEKQCAAPQ